MDNHPNDSIINALQDIVIPSITQNGAERMVVARRTLSEFRKSGSLPLGMYIKEKLLRSDPVKVRGQQDFGKKLVNARCSKDRLHSLRSPKLVFVLKGNITFQCGDALLYCHPEHIIYVPPDVLHSSGSHSHLEGTESPNGNCDLLLIGVHENGLVIWLPFTRRGIPYDGEAISISNSQSRMYFDILREQIGFSSKYAQRNKGALLLLMMTSIYEEIKEYRPLPRISRIRRSSPEDIAPRVREYVQNHVRKKITIDKVARHVYLSRTQFTSRFRKETGQSFHEYLSDYRFEMAKEWLTNAYTDTVARVGSRVGLTPRALRKMFAQRLEMSPTQYRQCSTKTQKTD